MFLRELPWAKIPEKSRVQFIDNWNGVEVWVLREDELHLEFGGNKWRKLKYPVLDALDKGALGIVSIGGAYSNHLAAMASCCAQLNIPCRAYLRGQEVNNKTIESLKKLGVELCFVPYESFKELKVSFNEKQGLQSDNWYYLPEGGSTYLGFLGCCEILGEHTNFSTHIVCPLGTGTTFAGLLNTILPHQILWGFSALKQFAVQENFITSLSYSNHSKYQIISKYAGKGFGKLDKSERDFANWFQQQYGIKPDPIYNTKLLLGLYQMAVNHEIPAYSQVLWVNTGGLQGWNGFENG